MASGLGFVYPFALCRELIFGLGFILLNDLLMIILSASTSKIVVTPVPCLTSFRHS